MTEKTISIEGLDSVDVYGVNDRKLDRMKHYFPEVRIIARGTDIRLEGPDEQVELLSQRIQALTAILRRGGGVSDSDLERMLDWQTYPSELGGPHRQGPHPQPAPSGRRVLPQRPHLRPRPGRHR